MQQVKLSTFLNRVVLTCFISLHMFGCGSGGGGDRAGLNSLTVYTLSGGISGAMVHEVTLTLSGTSEAKTTTNSSGNFSFTNLANGSYTVTPSLPGYSFHPVDMQTSIKNGNVTLNSFMSTAVNVSTYAISGSVKGASGVVLKLTGAEAREMPSDVEGKFSFAGLKMGDYTVTPVLAGFTFDPASIAVSVTDASFILPTFNATTLVDKSYLLGGTVTGAKVNGVLITLNGAKSGTTTTDASGKYSFAGLTSGNYTLTPRLSGYLFDPITQKTLISSADGVVGNFNAIADVASVLISPDAASISVLGTTQFNAIAKLSDGTDYLGNITWGYTCSSGDISLSNTGIATGKAPGTCNVTASAGKKSSSPALLAITAGSLLGGTIQGTTLNLTPLVSTQAGTGVLGSADGTGIATFNHPYGITTDGTNLYIAEINGNKIRKIEIVTGNTTTLAGVDVAGAVDTRDGVPSFNGPAGITTDGTNLYVADFYNNKIRKVAIKTGEVTTLAGSGTPGATDDPIGTKASFNKPHGMVLVGSNVYVADLGNHEIRKIDINSGTVSTLAGSGSPGFADGTGKNAVFNEPNKLTSDGSNLYVTDGVNCAIRKIVIASGVVTTLAGSGKSGFADGTGKLATFSYPVGITTDGTNLYVADNQNNKIRKIVISTGVVTSLTGAPGATVVAGAANGSGATSSFSDPAGIVSDGSNLFVADRRNHKIRKIQ